ncbi:MAG: hypothetical protein LBL07_17705 [Tannerella sp.]|jgi:hypothetical protein|nr:hypothetical protein [Tannerella sp.]
MKRWIYNTGFLLISMLILICPACSDEVIRGGGNGDTPGKGDKEIPVVISMQDLSLPGAVPTYAGGTDYTGETSVGGSSWENAVNDITVYIFNTSFECEKIVQATSSPTDTVMVKTGYKHFVAVVNAQGKMTLPSTPATTDYSALNRMLTDAAFTLPASPFLMTGELRDVALPDELLVSSPYSISIDVNRACAKMTLRVTKSGQSEGHTITLKTVTLHQGADRVALFVAPSPDMTSYTLSASKTVFDPATGAVPNKNTGTYCALADSFYTYESLCGSDKSKAVWIEIESAVNSPTNIRTAKFYLGEYSTTPGDTTYNIYRNYWYDVKVDIVKPGMDSIYVTVKACPWNMADIQDATAGGGYDATPSEPFKLVKNYTESELSSGNNGAFAAIGKHTKGQAYIDLKVSDGVGWSLAFQSSTGENAGAKMALGADSANWGTNWQTSLGGFGDDNTHRIWIYRPYVENAEPESGPTLRLTVGGVVVRDFIVQPRDTMPIPTNSYIMRPQLTGVPSNQTRVYIPLAGVYRFWEDEVLSNGDSIPDGTISAELLWKDRTGEVIKNISVINAGKRDQAYIYAEAGSIQGNAIVEMKVGGTTYWSFHLWVTEYNPYEAAGQKLYAGASTNIFMDRNLGALNNKFDAAGEARGLYYQFGRKDPYPRAASWGGGNSYDWFAAGNTNLGSITGVNLSHSYTSLRPRDGFETYLNNPRVFYTNVSVGSQPWPLYTEDHYLWDTEGGNKTAFDPCPEGWRIPKQDVNGDTGSPWKDILTKYTLPQPDYGNGRYYDNAGYYPYSGYISPATNPIINGAGADGYFWSSWRGTDGKTGTGLRIGSSETTSPTINMDQGLSVRCVADINYLLNTEGGGLFGNSAGNMANKIKP